MAGREKERRTSTRFAIGREIKYKLLNRKGEAETGEGTVINMSSNGILFSTNHVLVPGRAVEVSVNWPVQLNDSCPLKLVARGRVVRFDAGKAAIEFQQYEFRTAGSKKLSVRTS
jgi:hypothetical protein